VYLQDSMSNNNYSTNFIPSLYHLPQKLENLSSTSIFLREEFGCEQLLGPNNATTTNPDNNDCWRRTRCGDTIEENQQKTQCRRTTDPPSFLLVDRQLSSVHKKAVALSVGGFFHSVAFCVVCCLI
jgi:hypothetical protein